MTRIPRTAPAVDQQATPRSLATAQAVLKARLAAGLRLKQLLLVRRIAETGSLQRAAAALAMSQPAATQTLAAVEGLLELRLFERHARGMRLTAAGLRLLPVVQRLTDGMGDMVTDAVELQRGASTVLRIAALPTTVTGLLGEAVAAFHRRWPDVALEIEEAELPRMQAVMAAQATDLVLCRSDVSRPHGWCFEPLEHDHCVVVCAPTHPLARRKRLGLDDLAQTEWLLPPPIVRARGLFEAYCREQGFEPKVCRIGTMSAAVGWSLLRHLPLLGVVPWQFVRGFVEAGTLVVLPLALSIEMHRVGLAWIEGTESDALARMLKTLREVSRGRGKALANGGASR